MAENVLPEVLGDVSGDDLLKQWGGEEEGGQEDFTSAMDEAFTNMENSTPKASATNDMDTKGALSIFQSTTGTQDINELESLAVEGSVFPDDMKQKATSQASVKLSADIDKRINDVINAAINRQVAASPQFGVGPIDPNTTQEVQNLLKVAEEVRLGNVPFEFFAKSSYTGDTAVADTLSRADQMRKLQESTLSKIALGTNPESLRSSAEAEMKKIWGDEAPLEAAIVDPVNIIDAIGMGGIAVAKGGVKVGAKAMASTFAREAGRDLAYSTMASGFMAGSEASGAGPTMQSLTAILGTVAAGQVAKLSQRGLQEFLSNLFTNNRDTYNKLKTGEFGNTRVFRRLDAELNVSSSPPVTSAILEREIAPLTSEALQAGLSGDKKLIDTISNSVRNSFEPELANSQIQKIERAITGVEDMGGMVPFFWGSKNIPDVMSTDMQSSLKSIGAILADSPASTDLARNAKNALILSEMMGQRVIWDVLKANSGQYYEAFGLNINNVSKEYSLGLEDAAWGRAWTENRVGRWLRTTASWLGGDKVTDVVEGADFFTKQSMKLRSELDSAYSNIFKGAGKEDKATVFSILDEVNQKDLSVSLKGTTFELSDGRSIQATKEAVDLYAKTRNLLDIVYAYNNQTAVNLARTSGWKWAEDLGEQVRKIPDRTAIGTADDAGKVLTKEMSEQGFTMVENSKGVKSIVDASNERALRELNEFDQVIPYRQDYAPIYYEDEWRVMKIAVDKNGNVSASPFAAAKTEVEALKAVEKLKGTPVTGEEEKAIHFLAARAGDENMRFLIDNNFIDTLHSMSVTELKAMEKLLIDNGLDPSVVTSLTENVKANSYKRLGNFMERGERLKSAENLQEQAVIKPSQEAIAQYLQGSGRYMATAEFKLDLANKFRNTYGQYLEPSSGSTPKWDDNISKRVPTNIKKEIELVRNAVRISLDNVTEAEKHWVQKTESFATTLRKKGIALEKEEGLGKVGASVLYAAAKTIESAEPFGVARTVKGLSAAAYLGLGNISQAVVQATAAIGTIGRYTFTSPLDTLRGLNPAQQAFGHIGSILSGAAGSKGEGRYMYNLLRSSGFLSDVEMTLIDEGSKHVTGKKSLLSSAMTALKLPFDLGEALQRTVAWTAAREYAISEIEKSGRYLNFAAKDIDTPLFIKAVNAEAQKTSMNMSKYNAPLYSRDIQGVPFQFMQFASHQAELMFGKRLDPIQRAGVWAAYLGAFGVQGVPFIMDINYLGEAAAGMAGHPEATGAFDRWIDKASKYVHGIGKGALTNESINIVHRAAFGSMLNNFYDGVDLSDAAGPGLKLLYSMADGTVSGIPDFYATVTGQKAFTPSTLGPLKEVKGVLNPVLAGLSYKDDKLYSKSGKVVKEHPTMWEVLSTGMGIAPPSTVKVKEISDLNFRMNQRWSAWADTQAEKIAAASIVGDKGVQGMIHDAVSHAAAYNPMAANSLVKKIGDKMLERNLSQEQILKLRSVRNYYGLPDSVRNDLYGGKE